MACGALATFASAGELKVGEKAPDFKLPASDGQTYSLADFKGKEPSSWPGFQSNARVHDRVQVARGTLGPDQELQREHFMISVDARSRTTKGSLSNSTRTFPCWPTPPRRSPRPTACSVKTEWPTGGRSISGQTARSPRSTRRSNRPPRQKTWLPSFTISAFPRATDVRHSTGGERASDLAPFAFFRIGIDLPLIAIDRRRSAFGSLLASFAFKEWCVRRGVCKNGPRLRRIG